MPKPVCNPGCLSMPAAMYPNGVRIGRSPSETASLDRIAQARDRAISAS